MSETVRTFIAIEMPAEVRDFLGRCQERLRRSGGDVRWVRTDLIHLTLVFLGEVPVEMQGDLSAAVSGAVAGIGKMRLQAKGAGRFPPRGLPRVVWVGIDEPTGRLMKLQKLIAAATAAFAEKVEDRAYAAHLTLGRVKSGKNARSLDEAVVRMSAEAGPSFDAGEVTIFKSTLAADGPTYEAMVKIELI